MFESRSELCATVYTEFPLRHNELPLRQNASSGPGAGTAISTAPFPAPKLCYTDFGCQTTATVRLPKPSMVATILSPLATGPTPEGVPDMMMSPGASSK